MKTRILHCLLIALPILYAGAVTADVVLTADGARLIGTIRTITGEVVELDTAYAGLVRIKQSHVVELSGEQPLTSKLADGTVVTGVVTLAQGGVLEVRNETLNMRTSLGKLMAAWVPEQVPPEAAGFPRERKWRYTVGADITGRQGNSDEMGVSVSGTAILVGEHDELEFSASVDRAEKDGDVTSNEIKFGASYVTYVYDPLGWYVRTELEKDEFEGIDLRSVLSGGLSYRFLSGPDHTLAANLGLGYRYESFEDGTSEGNPTLDLSVNHRWKLQPWMTMTNKLGFAPSFTDFGDYIIVHDSAFIMPLADGFWNLRVGVQNDYKSIPAAGREKLDTTYYTRLLLNFE